MNKMNDKHVPDEAVFAALPKRTLADVLARCEADLSGTELRDTRSAFRFLEKRMAVDLGSTIARPRDLRSVFEPASPARLGITAKRLANIRSLIGKAVERFGLKPTYVTREIPLAPAWVELMQTIEVKQHRWALSRFAAYCTVKGISPADVTCDTLIGFQAALDAEETCKNPCVIRKHTIATWNMCRGRVPGWPETTLSWPLKREAYMFPLASFPQGFQDAVARWTTLMASADPFDEVMPRSRPLRPATIERHVYNFRRMASALVWQGIFAIDEVTGFEVFFQGENYKHALRPFQERSPDYLYKMAVLLAAILPLCPEVPAATGDRLDRILKRLQPGGGRQMGKRNRERLRQFDDEEVLRRLLAFPEEELARALELNSPRRRAKGVERALAISLLTFTGIRIKNLRSLRLDTNIRRAGSRMRLHLTQEETKTHRELEIELPPETVRILDMFVAEFRPLLPGADGPFLFPGEKGGPRSYCAMRAAVVEPLKKHAGIELSPHLYRHIIAKIIAERRPEHLHEVSRMLGHSSINTTYQSYLGTEGPAASRRIQALLHDLTGDDTAVQPVRKGRSK